MSISTVNSTTTPTTQSAASSSKSDSLDISSQEFLSLMVDQLINQNPLDPTDTDSYIDKLVSYASYDTQTEMSEDLDSINQTNSTSISSNGLGYIGMTIEANGSTTSLQDGSANWSYTLDSNASEVTVKVLDESGKKIYSESGESGNAGTYDFTWDGVTTDGEQMPDGGTYTISVEAIKTGGGSVSGSTTISGTVTGVDYSDGEAILMIGNAKTSVDSVTSVLSS